MTDSLNASVLFSCAGGKAGIAAIELARMAFPNLRIVATDSNPYSYVRHLSDSFFELDAPIDTKRYGVDLLSIIEQSGVDAALPCHSGEPWRYHEISHSLDELGVLRPIRTATTLAMLSDKLLMYEVLETAGLRVPTFAVGDSGGRRKFPGESVVLKPRAGAGSRGVAAAGPSERLPADSLFDPKRFIEQVAIEGEEISLDGVILSDGRVVGPYERRRLVVTDGAAIVSESIDLGAKAIGLFRRVAAALDSAGALNVQVFRTADGELYVTDVNLRFPAGGLGLTAALGLNMVEVVLRDLFYGPQEISAERRAFRRLRQYKRWTDVFTGVVDEP